MAIDGGGVRLQLRKGDHLTLKGARGARLTSIAGTAWITVDRDATDYMVPAGHSFVVPSDRSVLVGPLYGGVVVDLYGARRTAVEAVTQPRYA